MKYELVIKGGTVIDSSQNIHSILDVALANGKIAALESEIPATEAQQVIDASGKLVTPGLIDLHTHIYWGATSTGLEPDPISAHSGVTTMVDAGSSNAHTFAGFRRFIIEPAHSRIFARRVVTNQRRTSSATPVKHWTCQYKCDNVLLLCYFYIDKLGELSAGVVIITRADIERYSLGL